MTSNGKKLQKTASGNTALDKENIVELMKKYLKKNLQNSSSKYQKLLKTTW